DVKSSLHPGEALIATYVAPTQTYIWAVPASGPIAFAIAPLGHAQIKAMVKQLRKALDPEAATLAEIPPFDVDTAHQLYQALLKPVEAGWKGANNLLVVAQGPLAQLPFDVLVTEPYQLPAPGPGDVRFSGYRAVPFLARQMAVTWLPSVESLSSLRQA